MNIFKKLFNKKTIINISRFKHPQDTKRTYMHREQILIKLEVLLDRVMEVKYDRKLSTEEKFAIVWSSLITIQKISGEILESDKVFKEDEFEKIKKEIRSMVDEKPNYVG